MHLDLSGRTALITGGSDGLGLASAIRLSASGANVAIVARNPERLQRALTTIRTTATGRVEAFVCDVTQATAIEQVCTDIMASFGAVDILMNNAGYHIWGSFEDITDAMWQEDIDLKLMAAVRFSRRLFPGMKARNWGRIINILNVFAKAPKAQTAPTCVTRAATLALGKALAAEGAPHNVLVNGLAIGIIRSGQMLRGYEANANGQTFAEYEQQLAVRLGIPMGRMGLPEELANMVCFLASDASSYITGTTINVDGGMCPVT
jgi:NAD(P)-dependent dehydrogenase (short-subunit alcohol dehydrogenase family)